jgi:hypothetical protein
MAKTKTRTRKTGSKSMKAGSKSRKTGSKSRKTGSRARKIGGTDYADKVLANARAKHYPDIIGYPEGRNECIQGYSGNWYHSKFLQGTQNKFYWDGPVPTQNPGCSVRVLPTK